MEGVVLAKRAFGGLQRWTPRSDVVLEILVSVPECIVGLFPAIAPLRAFRLCNFPIGDVWSKSIAERVADRRDPYMAGSNCC
jgi:hypothetical protein